MACVRVGTAGGNHRRTGSCAVAGLDLTLGAGSLQIGLNSRAAWHMPMTAVARPAAARQLPWCDSTKPAFTTKPGTVHRGKSAFAGVGHGNSPQMAVGLYARRAALVGVGKVYPRLVDQAPDHRYIYSTERAR